jgi:hypothetical protein
LFSNCYAKVIAKIQGVCGDRLHQPKIVVIIRNINRPRGRLALKLFDLADQIDLFGTDNSAQANFWRDYLSLSGTVCAYFWNSLQLYPLRLTMQYWHSKQPPRQTGN